MYRVPSCIVLRTISLSQHSGYRVRRTRTADALIGDLGSILLYSLDGRYSKSCIIKGKAVTRKREWKKFKEKENDKEELAYVSHQ